MSRLHPCSVCQTRRPPRAYLQISQQHGRRIKASLDRICRQSRSDLVTDVSLPQLRDLCICSSRDTFGRSRIVARVEMQNKVVLGQIRDEQVLQGGGDTE
jgi:hypothetical protein